MIHSFTSCQRIAAGLVGGLLALSTAVAQPHREGGEQERVRERFQTPHMVFDNRFHHNHYYPSLGYSLPVLPVGYLTVPFRGAPFFFHAGVWYQRSAVGYIVVRPPIGIAIPLLPPGYATVWAGGVPYYYANDNFYVQGSGGYVVADPPRNTSNNMVDAPLQAPPPSAAGPQPAPSVGSGAPSNWFYCESSKAYYPYARECREGWREVPAVPPGQR